MRGALKALLKQTLPEPAWTRLRDVYRRSRRPVSLFRRWPPRDIYVRLYAKHIRHLSDAEIVGDGHLFDLIGRIELGVLLMEGLKPESTLLDFGCGTGRLAVHAVPRLVGGHYIGVEILDPILEKARKHLEAAVPNPPCQLTWKKQTTDVFPFEDESIDMICAFSVFTHLEHEDAYRYLKDARRIVRPGGRFVYSCLPMKHQVVYDIFKQSASDDFQARWSKVRNVTTSEDLMDAIARLAGWTPLRWYQGNADNIYLPDSSELRALGQSVSVLAPAGPDIAPM
jgi:ubiquinone/menaquinone biosynthesis C-methylase UbiE